MRGDGWEVGEGRCPGQSLEEGLRRADRHSLRLGHPGGFAALLPFLTVTYRVLPPFSVIAGGNEVYRSVSWTVNYPLGDCTVYL